MAQTEAMQTPPGSFGAESASGSVRARGFFSLSALFARALSAAACALLTFDPWARRLIPALLIVFLSLCAAVRALSLYEWHSALEAEARVTLRLAAAHLAAQADRAAETGQMQTAPSRKNTQAEEALPPALYWRALLRQFAKDNFISPAAQMLALDKDGRVIAARAADPERENALLGESLPAAAPEAKTLLILGGSAGAMPLRFDGEQGFAAYSPALRAPYGVFVFISAESLFRPWRESLSATIALLGGISALMLVLVCAYFAQGARARANYETAEKIRKRIDAAMLRGRCGLWDWDMARGRIYWSHSMYEMLGYRPYDTLLSVAEVASVIDADDMDLFEIAKDAMSGAQQQFDLTVPMRHANGSAVWMRIRARVQGGEEPHLVGISFDVTEQQERDEKNATADMRIRDAIENISEAFVLRDAENRLVMSNSKYREYTDLEQQLLQIRRRPPGAGGALFPAEKGAAYAEDKNGNYSGEVKLAKGDWLKLNGRRTKDGGFVLVGTDISALKEQQRKLEDKKEEFIGTIRDLQQARKEQRKRESEILKLNKSLTQEKKRAEDASLAKSEFLANMSHELRTPLNAVIGFSQMIMQQSFGPLNNAHYAEYIGDIHNSGCHLLNLINEILDMSKIEAGRFSLDCTKFDFVPLLEEALRAVSPAREQKQITLKTAIESPLWVEADNRALRQIALNLLSNAVKFTPQEGQIRVRAKAVRGQLLVSIADSGIGIPKTALAKLGRPFEQVENQFTKAHEGSGLGLAISRSLAEMHGGRLRIFSREGRGTAVSFSLPLRRSAKG